MINYKASLAQKLRTIEEHNKKVAEVFKFIIIAAVERNFSGIKTYILSGLKLFQKARSTIVVIT